MTSVSELKLGQKFKIPYPGGYAGCCTKAESAVYECVKARGWIAKVNNFGMKCVKCGETTPFDHTFVQVVEVV